MSKFLVVLSDSVDTGVPLGDQLVGFLQVYAPGQVKVTTPSEILRESSIAAEIVFVALPTSFGADHAIRLRWKKLVLFDCFDEPAPEWGASDQEFLSTLTDRYMKTHTDDKIDFGFRAGMLPIALSGELSRNYVRDLAKRRWRGLGACIGLDPRPWDICFFGAVTFVVTPSADGCSLRYHQRVEWIREIEQRKDFRFRGGLMELPYLRFSDLEGEGYSVPEKDRMGERVQFRELFTMMAHSKVSLTPTGHARWTYRHYESVYAGCDVVSTDLSGINTLLPLPAHCFEMVPDHQPVSPSVEKVLNKWRDRAPLREAAVEYLEQYLFRGRYDICRPAIFEQFLAQVEGD